MAGDPPRIAECRAGFDGHFKVGCWTPVWVGIAGDAAGRTLRVEATTIDNDGVRVSVAAPLETSDEPVDEIRPVLLYTKVGRIGAPIHVRLIADGETVASRFELSPNEDSDAARPFRSLPATSQLIVHLGASRVGLDEAFRRQNGGESGTARNVAHVPDIDALPVDWFGYEGVDVLVLTTADAELIRRLAGDRQRFAAVERWLELGGRVVVLAGGEAMPELLGEGGALAALVPGTVAEVVRLPETGALEHFAKSEVPLVPGGRATILVPQLVGAEGNIEVYAGRRPGDLPLVVRAARGLGEAAFVAVDLSAPPFDTWPGRKAFLQAVLKPYLSEGEAGQAAPSLVVRGYDDLSGALRQRLGRSFAGVAPFTFAVVTVLAIAYLVVLGPVDYLLVHRWLRRPWVGWVSFPLVVLVFGLAAMALGDWRTAGGAAAGGTAAGGTAPGGAARVNRLELVDIDTATGQARGTFWATLYSPRAEQFDLALDVETLAGAHAEPEVLLSWWGLPGVGIGGMQSAATDLGMVRGGYRYGPELASLVDVPVLTSSTKSLLARWTGSGAGVIEAKLADRDGLAEGFITNRTELPLRNLRLLYNGWAYRLGSLGPGRRIDVGDDLSPRRVKTIVTQAALGPASAGRDEGQVFVAQQATAEQILSLMMFHGAAGGFDFARLTNDYQAYCDFSRLLDLGRAILVADVPTRGSRLVDAGSGKPLADEPGETAVVYRFVLPVAKSENEP